MSEQSEHTSEETETDTNAVNCSNEQSKSDTSMINNQTGPAMLEDEEMPTYISVSSPSRREDSEISNTKQQEDRIPMEEDHSRSPYPSDDHGGGSVYVLSSGEESSHPPYHDEEEDEYGDSDDLDEMELENERGNAIMEEEEEEEEEDDDDENPLRLHNDDDDDIDGEYEAECLDRASDDFILNNRLKKSHKERSLSLQDLSVCKNNIRTPYNKKRHSLNILRQNYLGSQQNPMMYPVTHRKQSMPLRYRHVESKVKRYIKDIKEQNRRSMERRNKDLEYAMDRNHTEDKNNDIELLKSSNKTIKDYAELAIKDLQREEEGENESQRKYLRRENEMDVYCSTIENENNAESCDGKTEKRNGSVDGSGHHGPYEGSRDRSTKFSDSNEPSLMNGHQQAPTLFNLRTLSYEEYMHGSCTSNRKDGANKHSHGIQEDNNEVATYNDGEIISVPETDNSNPACPLKIESVKSIRMVSDESKDEPENFAKVNQVDKASSEDEVTQLKTQLGQKTAQFNTLRDAYQKTLAENLKMKQELDALKKSMAKYESKNTSADKKAVSVQTEIIRDPTLKEEAVADVKETNNKISTSSVVSTISSIEWTDSACSPTISIKPPDLTAVLNSDDSMILTEGTPRKTARPLSRAFITSSRILQTLSSITQGKTKPESPLVRGSKKRLNENSTEQLLNVDYSSPIHASNSKKRKATDMLETSTFVQPFKIPHTTLDAQKKNFTSATDAEFKYPGDHATSKQEQQQNPTTSNRTDNLMDVENAGEETEENEDNVKCFVYQEDENSKDRSFLIQAEEPTKDGLANEKGRVRECGPYLLGNVEVRMSEVNGTISIWGKEISQESMTENEEEAEADVSIKPTEKSMCRCWQKTQTRFNGSPLVCSTNKKPKVAPRFSGSNVSQCSHSASPNATKTPFLIDDIGEKRHINSPFSPNLFVPSCENCDSAKHRREWPTCKQTSGSQEKIHSCCMHHVEPTERVHSCAIHQDKHKCDDSPNYSRDKLKLKGIRRSFHRNTPDLNKHLYESLKSTATDINETICKYNTSCRCSTQNATENYQQNSKCCNAVRDVSYSCKSSLPNTSGYENTDRHSCNHSLSNDGDEDLLIPLKRSNETPETRQRRLSGKRVRGILMDLIRGCGDCRNVNPTGSNKADSQEKEIPYLANGPPQIKISPCNTPEPSCSNPTQSGERCCHAYARRIESQLEEFRIEMERVRSRSDAILDMLSMLHSVDMN